jgi:hypothetical protein
MQSDVNSSATIPAKPTRRAGSHEHIDVDATEFIVASHVKVSSPAVSFAGTQNQSEVD